MTLRTFCQALNLNAEAYSQLERGIYEGPIEAGFIWQAACYLTLDALVLLVDAYHYQPDVEAARENRRVLNFLKDPGNCKDLPKPENLPVFLCRTSHE